MHTITSIESASVMAQVGSDPRDGGILTPRNLQELWEQVHVARPEALADARHLGQAVLRSGLVPKAKIQAVLIQRKTLPLMHPMNTWGACWLTRAC